MFQFFGFRIALWQLFKTINIQSVSVVINSLKVVEYVMSVSSTRLIFLIKYLRCLCSVTSVNSFPVHSIRAVNNNVFWRSLISFFNIIQSFNIMYFNYYIFFYIRPMWYIHCDKNNKLYIARSFCKLLDLNIYPCSIYSCF